MKITFSQDQDAENPRNFEPLGTLSCRKHRQYTFGDEQFDGSLDDFVAKLPKNSLVIPVYIYQHGDIAISTTPFSCQWDSAQLGVMWVSPAKLRGEYGNAGAKARATALGVLESEVKQYAHYVSGETYCLTVERDGEEPDSCSGFYGNEVFSNGMDDQFSDDELPLLLQAAQEHGMHGTPEELSQLLAQRLEHRTRQALGKTQPRSRL